MTLSITDEERWRLVDEYIASYTEEYGKLEVTYLQLYSSVWSSILEGS